jgi:CRISPR/Cas system CSM-associated protein Csm2 small subunit
MPEQPGRKGEIVISREAWKDLVAEKRQLVMQLQEAVERAVRAEDELAVLKHRLEELRS